LKHATNQVENRNSRALKPLTDVHKKSI